MMLPENQEQMRTILELAAVDLQLARPDVTTGEVVRDFVRRTRR